MSENNNQRFNTEEMLHHIDKRFDDIDLKFEQVNTKFEQVNTKLEKQKVWFITTAISIVVASCTIIGFLIKFIK
jgi:tetrahydromethanopterin S-methyltransferase subunit G